MNSFSQPFHCWASCTGECNRLSGEHLVSEALFPERRAQVQGFDWCQDEPKTIGIGALIGKVLCVRHNNALSETDQAAVKALALFRRSASPPQPGDASLDRTIDGLILERWLLKTAINLSFQGSRHIGVGMTDSELGWPSPYLVDVALGRAEFSHLLGAHFLIPKEESQHSPTEIVVMPVVRADVIGGVYFELRSQPVFLNLFPGSAPPTLGSIADLALPQVLLDAPLVYRPEMIATAVEDRPTGLVRFRWGGPTR